MSSIPPDPSVETAAATPRTARAARKASARRRLARRLLIGLVAVTIGLGVLATALWIGRREAARSLLVGWLDQRGIRADVDFESVELDRLVASITIGDPASPDVTVERVEVDYVIAAPWSRTGLGVTPNRIRLVRPVVAARWTEGRFSLGSLDPLIDEFASRPPDTTRRGPIVLVEGGRVRLTTEYGVLTAFGDARLDDGRLMALDARVPAASLKSGETTASLTDTRITVATTGPNRNALVSRLTLNGGLARFRTASVAGESVAVSLDATVPYPDRTLLSAAQPFAWRLATTAGSLDGGSGGARAVDARLSGSGELSGWFDAFSVSTRVDGAVVADAARAPGTTASGARLALDGTALSVRRQGADTRWRLAGPTRLTSRRLTWNDTAFDGLSVIGRTFEVGGRDAGFEASGPLAVAADRFAFGDLRLSGLRGDLALDVVGDGPLRIDASGGLRSAGGAWPLFGPGKADDGPEIAAMKAALGDFRLAVPRFAFALDGDGLAIRLPQAVTLAPANGGVLTVSETGAPIYAARAGEFGGGRLALSATRGRGLPQMRFDIPSWRLTPTGFEARLAGRAALDFTPAEGLAVATTGLLVNADGVLTYRADGCSDFTATKLELGENDATGVSGRFCPVAGAPLVMVRDGGWLARGRAEGVAAAIPSFQVAVADAAAGVTARGLPAGLTLEAEIASARLSDTARPLRFRPLGMTGAARLANERWSGGVDLTASDARVAHVDFAHDGAAEAGGLSIDTGELVFAPEGLQPSRLTPLLDDAVAEPVTGSARFQGRFDWTPSGVTSSGVVSTPGLDFTSPLGPVEGLAGTVELTSLTPLLTAPDQSLTVRRVGAFAPLSELALTFDVDADSLNLDAFDLAVAGGRIHVDPVEAPLNGQGDWSGVITLDRVQLGEIVAASSFADKISMDAVVSGRLPFTANLATGLRVQGGTLAAVQPGRLSINRAALTGVEAGGAGEGVPPNMVQDLAYQAMENLAFDVLSADLNSLDEGRLGVLFRIRGRHDPPVRQELRLTWLELIRRDFLNRELPLPSGTDVDLTLDTTINANQLVSDYLALQRARRGEREAAAPAVPTAEEAQP